MDGRWGIGGFLNLCVFAVAFALVEAAVVVYLRALAGIDTGAPFPLRLMDPRGLGAVFAIERYREAATLILILIPALLVGKTVFERVLLYAFVFGIWDLAYYAFLRGFTGWPKSLLDYDGLFLLPTVWVAPVICPVLVALGLVGFVIVYVLLARRRAERLPHLVQWLLAVGGGGLVLGAFLQHAQYYLAGGMPPRFSWLLFLMGYATSVAGGLWYLLDLARQPRTRFH